MSFRIHAKPYGTYSVDPLIGEVTFLHLASCFREPASYYRTTVNYSTQCREDLIFVFMVPQAGFEPATDGLKGRYSTN